MEYECIKNELYELLEVARKNKDRYMIYFVANVENITKNHQDYKETSIVTEFLSFSELDEILKSCNKFGFYSKVFFETNDLFQNLINESKHNSDNIIVFEFTQKGIEPGKDALIPSFCDLNNIKYTGSNAYTNAICSNKYNLYLMLNKLNVPMPDSYLYKRNNTWLSGEIPKNYNTLISKPVFECASIGITQQSKTQSQEELEKLLQENVEKYMQDFIVQKFIYGYEIEIPFIVKKKKPIILPAVGISIDDKKNLKEMFLDFKRVESDAYSFYQFEDKQIPDILSDVEKIIGILHFNGYGRMDLRIDNNGYYFTDINSYPHIVKHSSMSNSLKYLGFETADVVPLLIGNAILNSTI